MDTTNDLAPKVGDTLRYKGKEHRFDGWPIQHGDLALVTAFHPSAGYNGNPDYTVLAYRIRETHSFFAIRPHLWEKVDAA